MIPYSRQTINDDDIKAVTDVLKSDFLTTGPKVPEFEQAICDYCGCDYAVAFNSGTSALYAAVRVCDNLQEYVSLPANTFIATANAVLLNGKKLDIIDIGNNSAKDACDLDMNISVDYAGDNMSDCCIIRDSAHSLGSIERDAYYKKNHKTGSCYYSEMTCFSFHPLKSITTAEGGMVTTNNEKYYEKLKAVRDNGRIKGDSHFPSHNFRMSDIHAALGISQFKRIDEFVARRREIAKRYVEAFEGNIKFAKQNFNHSAYHLFPILLENRDAVREHLTTNEIGTQIHYMPLTHHKYLRENKSMWKAGDLSNAEKWFKTELSIPIYPDLKNNQVDFIIEKILEVAECR